ncbi:MAG: hypothetical protein JST68_15960 [Bacteroidetes bacterium]|nr:hypothetical protein [Bacteroidota bacterium]
MKKRGIHIIRRLRLGARQLLLGLIALQILNLSVGNPGSWDDTSYDYSYTYNKTYDPTESAVEWIVELSCGQQPDFSYSLHESPGKTSQLKNWHWKTDLQQVVTEIKIVPIISRPCSELPAVRIPTQPKDTFSPPPEQMFA